jgi:microcystin-dependent protein
MATVTKGRTFTSGETVTPAKLNDVVDLATVTNIVDADIGSGAAIAASKLASTLDLSSKTVTLPATISLPAGAVMSFAMNSAPTGWLAADGTAVSRSTYADLFTAIGTTYGAGDGSTTFALPDLRGYFVRGSGTNGDGTAAGAFGTKQVDEFKSHTHTVVDSSFTVAGAGGGLGGLVAGSVTRTTSSTGGDETRPKNIAMLYCIKF